METMKNWMTQDELRKKWDVSPQTVRNWREQGLPCYEVGKKICFIESEVITFIREKHAIKAIQTRRKTRKNNMKAMSELPVTTENTPAPNEVKVTPSNNDEQPSGDVK